MGEADQQKGENHVVQRLHCTDVNLKLAAIFQLRIRFIRDV